MPRFELIAGRCSLRRFDPKDNRHAVELYGNLISFIFYVLNISLTLGYSLHLLGHATKR